MKIGNWMTHMGADKDTLHSYGRVYDMYLADRREEINAVLEIGVSDGNSLVAWSFYLPQAQIVGLDKDPALLFERGNIYCVLADQSSADSLWIAVEPLGMFDLIVDSGSHRPKDQEVTLNTLWQYLRVGGLYVIEDVQTIEALDYFAQKYGCKTYDLRKVKGQHDDMLAILEKH